MKDLLVVLAIIVLCVSATIAFSMWMVSVNCAAYQSITGRTSESRFVTCYVKTEKGFIPVSEFEARSVTNKAKK